MKHRRSMPSTGATQRSRPARGGSFLPGIDVLLTERIGWIKGRRVGLVSHAAAVDAAGCHAAQRLRDAPGVQLSCLLGPEHGFFSRAGAGEACGSVQHPDWNIPVFSLYGDTRKPTPEMLSHVDLLVVDLQDLGARAYTYVSTLALVMEAAAEAGKPVIVADRPVPLPNTVDGPMPDGRHRSFVSWIDAPLSYGMTPGETALWLRRTTALDLDLRVAPLRGYRRDPARSTAWFPWIPPSPAIRSWECAMCFPATVAFEALGAVDHGRTGPLPFQVLGSAWMDGTEVCARLREQALPGVCFHPHRYVPTAPAAGAAECLGVRMSVTDPDAFQPVTTGYALIRTLEELYGRRRVWTPGVSRPEFFDKLMGTDSVRTALRERVPTVDVARQWREASRSFRRQRLACLLYERPSVR